mmetsp:Transcript_9021/g.19335  ORF Transcript_9021/g.19335 Transcript_9021/m.19335 type:complete len:96 (-) Transcript_9021:99-386(-)
MQDLPVNRCIDMRKDAAERREEKQKEPTTNKPETRWSLETAIASNTIVTKEGSRRDRPDGICLVTVLEGKWTELSSGAGGLKRCRSPRTHDHARP